MHTKKFSLISAFSVLFLLAGCGDEMNKLTVDELLSEADGQYAQQNYDDAIRFLESYELRFPVHVHVPESVYKRAMSYYLSGKYAQAVAVFEVFLDRYPMHDKKVAAHKYMFYCFYNQVTRYDRDYSLLEKAIEYGNVYKGLVYDDKEFNQAYSNLQKFMVYYYLHTIHSSLSRSPKYWIQALWNSHIMIMQHPKHLATGEAYYRIIEFLCAQNSHGAREDALDLLAKMKIYHANTQWYTMALKCIAEAKEVFDDGKMFKQFVNESENISDNAADDQSGIGQIDRVIEPLEHLAQKIQ